jgi:hypothetical protein
MTLNPEKRKDELAGNWTTVLEGLNKAVFR